MRYSFLFARKFPSQEIPGVAATFFLAAVLALLGGCNAGAGDPCDLAPGSTACTQPPATGTPTLTLALTNAAGAPTSTISVGAPATVTATLKDAAGAAVSGAVVTFSTGQAASDGSASAGTDATLATISPAATALTNASGVATVTLNVASSAGAGTLRAQAQVGSTSVSGSIGFAVGTPATPGASSGPTLTLALTNAGGATVTSISVGAPATAKATLKDATGAAVSGAVVTFSTGQAASDGSATGGTEATLATISPAATALTDASGVATVTLNVANAAGAGTLRAQAQVGSTTVSGSIGFAVGIPATSIAPTLTLALTNNGGATVTSISAGAPATVKATLRDAKGAAVSGAVVTFSAEASLATISPAATALTDASGVATVTLSVANSAGAGTVSATAQVGSTPVSGSTAFAAIPAPPSAPSLTLALTNASGATVSSISTGAPATLKATLRDAKGAAVSGAVVTFSAAATLATINPATTALTDATGVATVILSVASSAGAGTVSAAAQVGSTPVSSSIAFAAIPATPGASTLTLALTNAAGATTSTISVGAPATVKATLRDGTGAAVSGAIVTFSTDATLASISPAATVLTNASGVATVTLNAATIQTVGAGVLTAASQVGSAAVSGTTNFAVGLAAVAVSAPVFGVAPLSAYGNTSVSVTVTLNGVPVATPLNVNFSSSCASVGKAVLTTGAATVNGVATGSYRDNGCAGTDVITASTSGATSPSSSLVVTPPTTGSIQFVSATPSIISLRGIGGTEAAQVRFRVLDAGGNPLSGKTVNFCLSTMVGGITLTPSTPTPSTLPPCTFTATAISDASGLVVVGVNSGTVSTPVRVTAFTLGATAGTTLTTQSSALTITTGIPDQDSFSLSANVLNPEFGNIEGNTIELTARLADHFNNPVPDGTVVNFTTSGGSIVATCSTAIDSNGNSNCSTKLTSQAPRPAGSRVTVLAYAVGEESFIDLNGNGVADVGEITDLPEAFRDDFRDDKKNGVFEKNGLFDAGLETFLDFNQNGVYDGPDTKYSGVLCDHANNSFCSKNKTIHVRASVSIIFSGSFAAITKIEPSGTINLGGNCIGATQQVDLRVVDLNGNPMPAGTTITVTTTNGTMVGTSSFKQSNTNYIPPAGAANYTVFIKDDSAMTPTLNPVTGVTTLACVDPNPSGVLTVTVTTPGTGTIGPTPTTAQFSVSN